MPPSDWNTTPPDTSTAPEVSEVTVFGVPVPSQLTEWPVWALLGLSLAVVILGIVLITRKRNNGDSTGENNPGKKESRADTLLAVAVVVMTMALLGLAFYGSFFAVSELASGKVSPPWLVPIVIDGCLLAFIALDMIFTRANDPNPLLKNAVRGFTALTLVANGLSGWPDAVSVLLHIPAPLAIVVITESGRGYMLRSARKKARGEAGQQEQPEDEYESIPFMRWILAPWPTALLWRRMILWNIRSYKRAIDMDIHRRDLLDRCEALGSDWQEKMPTNLLRQLREGINLDRVEHRVTTLLTSAGVSHPAGVTSGLGPVTSPAPVGVTVSSGISGEVTGHPAAVSSGTREEAPAPAAGAADTRPAPSSQEAGAEVTPEEVTGHPAEVATVPEGAPAAGDTGVPGPRLPVFSLVTPSVTSGDSPEMTHPGTTGEAPSASAPAPAEATAVTSSGTPGVPPEVTGATAVTPAGTPEWVTGEAAPVTPGGAVTPEGVTGTPARAAEVTGEGDPEGDDTPDDDGPGTPGGGVTPEEVTPRFGDKKGFIINALHRFNGDSAKVRALMDSAEIVGRFGHTDKATVYKYRANDYLPTVIEPLVIDHGDRDQVLKELESRGIAYKVKTVDPIITRLMEKHGNLRRLTRAESN